MSRRTDVMSSQRPTRRPASVKLGAALCAVFGSGLIASALPPILGYDLVGLSAWGVAENASQVSITGRFLLNFASVAGVVLMIVAAGVWYGGEAARTLFVFWHVVVVPLALAIVAVPWPTFVVILPLAAMIGVVLYHRDAAAWCGEPEPHPTHSDFPTARPPESPRQAA